MPRKNRFAPPGHWLHITQRGNDPSASLPQRRRSPLLPPPPRRPQPGALRARRRLHPHVESLPSGRNRGPSRRHFALHDGLRRPLRHVSQCCPPPPPSTSGKAASTPPCSIQPTGPPLCVTSNSTPSARAWPGGPRIMPRTLGPTPNSPAPLSPLADARRLAQRRMLASGMRRPVLDLPQPHEINRAKIDVTKNSAQCANFERPASMDGDGCAYFISRHHMMTPTDAHDGESLGFQKSYHLHAREARCLRHEPDLRVPDPTDGANSANSAW